MKKLLSILVFSLLFGGSAFALSLDRERYEYQQCVQILVDGGKSFARSNKYCVCSVKMTSKKYTDKELDEMVSKGMDYLNKKTKSIAKKCAKEANAQ
ncbi:hypothetical protein [Candidatus Pelagibacter sp.]|uniref:hypothetical protein n=1 Tax=Candidatus Pelagibacter sp. TaxID=2024849 RepID=UPI003F847410